MKKSSNFVEHAQTRDEANLYSFCCVKHGYSKPKCHNSHIGQLILVSVQRTQHTHPPTPHTPTPHTHTHTQKNTIFLHSSRLVLWWLVPNSVVMPVAAILRSRLLKMTENEKLIYLCNSAEVAIKIEHAVITREHTSTGMKISVFFFFFF